MEDLIKQWVELGAGKACEAGNPHPRVYMFTKANRLTQSLFKLDFYSFGVNKFGIYCQTESCWNWVATIDLATGNELDIHVKLSDADTFDASDIYRLMRTFAESCGIDNEDQYVITESE